MGELVDRDQEHLRLLKLGFYMMAGTTGFFSLFSLLYIAMGSLLFGTIPIPEGSANNPRLVAQIFVGIGLAFFLMGLATTFLTYLAGRSLGERRRLDFCKIIAGLWCLWVPFGTVLGACALVVLNRDSVEALFERRGMPPPLPSKPHSAEPAGER